MSFYDTNGKRVLAASVKILLVLTMGCGPSTSSLVGTYDHADKDVNEAVVLKADQTYEQQIAYPDGAKFMNTNTWERVNGVVEFHHFLVSFDEGTGAGNLNPPEVSFVVSFSIYRDVLSYNYERGYYFRKRNR